MRDRLPTAAAPTGSPSPLTDPTEKPIPSKKPIDNLVDRLYCYYLVDSSYIATTSGFASGLSFFLLFIFFFFPWLLVFTLCIIGRCRQCCFKPSHLSPLYHQGAQAAGWFSDWNLSFLSSPPRCPVQRPRKKKLSL